VVSAAAGGDTGPAGPARLPRVASTPTLPGAPARTAALARAAGAVLRGAPPARWLLRLLAAAALPGALLLLWQLSAARGWVSELVLPPAALVWSTFRSLWADGAIQAHVWVSTVRVAKGFLVGASGGLAAGTLLGLSASARAYLLPTLTAVLQVNILACVPLFILLFGVDEALKVAVVAWATLLPVTLNALKGFDAIPGRWLELARVYQLRPWEVVLRVATPAALPTLFVGLRTGLAAAWASLVMVELIASSEGVGYLVVWGRQLFQLDLVLAAIVLIGALGLGLDLVLRLVERRLRAAHLAAG
jgi:sulfonate transport system permease protein